MPHKKSVVAPDPGRFNLTTFADMLSHREPIVGEVPGSYPVFHAGLTQSFALATPYEAVVAESLIRIEWELLQHRRMRDASLRASIRKQIRKAVITALEVIYNQEVAQDLEDHLVGGGEDEDWDHPGDFDEDAAREAGQDLAARASSQDPQVQAEAYEEIEALGITPLDLMRMAYNRDRHTLDTMDDRIRDREQRRHEILRDFERLQAARRNAPTVEDAEVIEAEVIDGGPTETKAPKRTTKATRRTKA
jgi:hypothetical protein